MKNLQVGPVGQDGPCFEYKRFLIGLDLEKDKIIWQLFYDIKDQVKSLDLDIELEKEDAQDKRRMIYDAVKNHRSIIRKLLNEAKANDRKHQETMKDLKRKRKQFLDDYSLKKANVLNELNKQIESKKEAYLRDLRKTLKSEIQEEKPEEWGFVSENKPDTLDRLDRKKQERRKRRKRKNGEYYI